MAMGTRLIILEMTMLDPFSLSKLTKLRRPLYENTDDHTEIFFILFLGLSSNLIDIGRAVFI